MCSGLVALLPDLDAVYYGRVAYKDFLGHRGFWHSPFVLTLLGIVLGLRPLEKVV